MPIAERDRIICDALRKMHDRGIDLQPRDGAPKPWDMLGKHFAAPGELPFRARIEAGDDTGMARIEILSGGPDTTSKVCILPAGVNARLQAERQDDVSRKQVVRLKDAKDELHLRPGNIICDAEAPAAQSDMFSLNVLWLGEEPMYAGRTYRISGMTGEQAALVGKLKNRIDLQTGLPLAARHLERGEIGQVEIELDGSLVYDTQETPTPLAFLLFKHDANGAVVGIGIIRFALRRASNIRWQELELDKHARAAALGQKPLVLWFTGLSGCGKSTVASLLEKRLHEMGRHTYVLDGDNVRHGLCKDLGFTKADRVENMRRVTEVAKLMVDAGLIVLVTFISPFREERAKARASFEEGEFVEVFVDTPLEICEARDIKGLYAKARAGLIRNFTGIDSPYEPPESPEIHLHGDRMSTEDMVEEIIRKLWQKRRLETTHPNDTCNTTRSIQKRQATPLERG